MTDKTEKPTFTLPEGRVINHSLFALDQFKEGDKPQYKVELAFPTGALEELKDALANAAADYYGDAAFDGFDRPGDANFVRSPIISGDKLAKKREDKGKTGDAYKGMSVIRAHTTFNQHGQNGPGGVFVCGPGGAEDVIEQVRAHEVYNGCYGIALVTIGAYQSNEGDNALTVYLNGFQKTKEGEKLVSERDFSDAFKAVGRDQEGGTGGRKRRKG